MYLPVFSKAKSIAQDIVFVPDGSAQAPSAYLSIADGQSR